MHSSVHKNLDYFQFEIMAGKKKSPLKDIQILIHRTCKSYKNIFADVIKLRILWWEDYPRLLWWALNAIPFIIIFIRVR